MRSAGGCEDVDVSEPILGCIRTKKGAGAVTACQCFTTAAEGQIFLLQSTEKGFGLLFEEIDVALDGGAIDVFGVWDAESHTTPNSRWMTLITTSMVPYVIWET